MSRSNRPRILLVEDEPDLVRVFSYNLEQAGFETRAAGRVKDAIRTALEDPPDAILLDLMLPDGSGTEVCRTLKADPRTRNVPILMVTARGEEVDRVVGFELGADDYVTKPVSVRELVLRVRAVLRRSDATESVPPPAARTTFGRLSVDRTAHRTFVDGEEIVLTALEFKLLQTLLERRNRVQSRETLLNDVWDLHLHVETRTVDTHIKRLREKLGEAGAYIHTVRGVGYRFAETPDEAQG